MNHLCISDNYQVLSTNIENQKAGDMKSEEN